MPVIYEGNTLGDLLKYESPNLYSREAATVGAGQHLALGTIVSRDAGTGKLYPLRLVSETDFSPPAGVLATDTDARLADRDDALLIARHAIVASQALIWPDELTQEQRTLAIEQLAQLGILVRQSA
jgi:hypothetical protein